MHTFDMYISDLKFLAVVIGVITVGCYIVVKYYNRKESKKE